MFKENLRCLRENAGLTQTALAKNLDITPRKISYLESGQFEPDISTLVRVAKFFSVSTDFLLGLKDY